MAGSRGRFQSKWIATRLGMVSRLRGMLVECENFEVGFIETM